MEGNQSCKEQLVQEKVEEAEKERFGGRKESLEMHQGHAVWMPRTVTIKGCGDQA